MYVLGMNLRIYLSMYVCVCVFMYTFFCVSIYVCNCVHMYVVMYMIMYVCMYVCFYLFTHFYGIIYLFIIYLFTNVCMCACINIYEFGSLVPSIFAWLLYFSRIARSSAADNKTPGLIGQLRGLCRQCSGR